MITQEQSPLLTVRDVAKRLAVSDLTVRRLIDKSELQAFQLGGPGTSLRVDAHYLEDWLEARRQPVNEATST